MGRTGSARLTKRIKMKKTHFSSPTLLVMPIVAETATAGSTTATITAGSSGLQMSAPSGA